MNIFTTGGSWEGEEGRGLFIIIHLHDLLTHLVPYDFIIYIYNFFVFLTIYKLNR